MKYAIENAESSRLLAKLRPRKCESCGHVHHNPNKPKWTDRVGFAMLFESRDEASAMARKVFDMKTGPRRRPKVIEIGS